MWCSQLHGPDCPGDCPGQGCFEALVSGNAIGREGMRAAAEQPDSQLGRRLAADKEISGGVVTELAHGGDPLAREVLDEIGRRLGYGLVGLVNTFNPEVIVIGGGAVRGGDLLLSRRARWWPSGRSPPARERGSHRARPLRRRGGDDGRGAARIRPSGARRRERPARGLPDADREPRGHDAAGAVRAARGRRGGLRGHAPDAGAARPLRGQGEARLLPRAQRAGAAAELVGRMREGAVVALVSDAGMPLVSDPGYVLVRACVAAGLPVEVLPGPSAAITALVASGLPADEWHFHGLPPAQEGRAARGAVAAGRPRSSPSSRRVACRPRWPCWPSSTRSARWPSAAS